MIRTVVPLVCALVILGACSSSTSDSSADAGSDASADATAETATTVSIDAADDDELGISVNGTELTVAEFNDYLESWARIVEGQGGTVRNDTGLLPDFVGEITAQYLQFETFMDAIEADGVEITDADRASAEESVLASMGEPNDEVARALAVEWLSGLAAMEPSEAELDAYVDENSDELSVDAICSSHILVATAEEADAVIARIDAGEDFADLAAELSTDPGSGAAGGDLGCVGPGAFVPEFEEAALAAEFGVMTEPVESEFGFHLIVTREAGAEDLQPIAASQFETAAAVLLNDSLLTATVEVAPQFGTWDAAEAIYSPPA